MSEWTLRTAMAHWAALRKADRRALKLQAAEYERRLESLNHAHEQARQKEAEYVTRDKYEDWIKQNKTALDAALLRINEKLDTQDRNHREQLAPLNTYVASQQGSTSGKLSQRQFLFAFIGLIGTLLFIGTIVVGIAYAIRR